MRRKNNKPAAAALLAAALLALSACSSVKRELGVDRHSPDEFTVVKRAPLTLPPDYMLRPPADPALQSPAAETAETAETILMGGGKTSARLSGADRTLLDKIGADSANPDIRRQIDEENGYISLENRSVANKLIFWNDEAAPAAENVPSSVVDPKAEAERLKKNKDAGKPLNEGDVPVIEKKGNTLDKLF